MIRVETEGGCMKPRKGHKVKVIKNREVVAVCENIGEAVRLTCLHNQTIRSRMKDGQTTKGYRFQEVEQ